MKLRYVVNVLLLTAALMLIAACGAAPSSDAPAGDEATTDSSDGGSETAAADESSDGEMMSVADIVPSEYPEPNEIEGARATEKLPLDEIVTYKALDSYSEPDWVTELVEAGELPPVEERLPLEPRVALASGMTDGIGQYGGVWRDFSACPSVGFNRGAGQSAGWFGIESAIFASLLKSGPIYRRSDAVEPLPFLAKSWEWSEDGMELTMHLIEGAKWSDGHPFTTEDVDFTWNHMILDPNVNSPKGASAWEIEGEMTQLEIIDEFSFKFIFPVAKPVFTLFLMDEGDFHISPKHFLEPLHPAFNEDTDYVEFTDTAMPLDAVPVVLGRFVPIEYKTDEIMILRRNPYFWGVDEEGQQLPYLDEVVFEKGPSGVGRTINTLAGSADHSNLENPSTYIETLTRAAEDDAHFYVEWGPELLGFGIDMNYSTKLGITSDRDLAVRELFRDLRFRKALSLALDREAIAQSILRGPFIRGYAGGMFPGSSYFDRSVVAYYNNDANAARALLADMGLEDTDGNGILNFLDGGEDIVIGLDTSEDAEETQTVGDAAVTLWSEIGIKVNARPLNSAARNDLNVSGEWDMRVSRYGQAYAVPFTRCTDLGPVTKEYGIHREGSEPREFMDFELEIIDLVNAFCLEADQEVRNQQMAEYNQIFTENVYQLGVIISRHGLAAAKRFNNIPAGMPVFMYQWTWDNAMAEQVWVDPSEQIDQIRPGVIPTYQ
ncbi:MAG: ABC transporter substrate-binding protein [Chloroflexota bacterium]